LAGKTRPERIFAFAACLFYTAASALFIPLLGIQNDEALFGNGVYDPTGAVYEMAFRNRRISLMIMSYVGALKAWIYVLIFRVWRPSAASIRMPMVLAGAATLYLFFAILRRVAGLRAAVLGCALLATDVTYLLTNCLDWGPVALQHLCLLGSLAFLLRHHEIGGLGSLAGGFVLWGLGLWDKAIFIWSLGGLGISALLVFPRELFRLVTWRRIAVAVPAFCLGALPLIVYNVDQPLATFRSNTAYDASDLKGKATLLHSTLDGSALFGWLSPGVGPNPNPPGNLLQEMSLRISEAAGRQQETLMPAAAWLALGLFPVVVWRERGKARSPVRVLAFALIFLAVVWLQMALTKGAGGGVHHAILLWPFPICFIAIVFSAASRWLRSGKALLAGLLAILTSANILTLNQYYVDAFRYGGALNWTDAIYPLSDYLKKHPPAREVYSVDWGILDDLRLLSRGRLALRVGNDFDNAAEVRRRVSDPESIFVGHTEGMEFFTGSRAKLRSMAAGFGFRPEVLAVISDRNGRPTFEVYRFVR